MSTVDNLLGLLERGQDNALLRFSLGNEYHRAGDLKGAAEHLAQAVEQDPEFSAAWKLYGKSLAAAGFHQEAATAFETGIAVADRNGDIQAAKEMRVFLKRVRAGD